MDTAAKPATTAPTLSIDVDSLTSLSQLKSLLRSNAKPTFQFFAELAPYMGQSIADIKSAPAISVSISQAGSWTTATGIGFSLTPTLKCSAEIITSGPVLTYAPDLKSEATSELPAAAYDGAAYIKLSLGFTIAGKVSGSGNAGPVGISGNASGSVEGGIVCCHRVPGNMTLEQALQDAFEHFVFPLEPATAKAMPPGDIAQCTFRAKLALSAAASYGLGSLKYSAQDASSIVSSASKGFFAATPPGVEIDFGLKASIDYTHDDDFSAIVQKLDGNSAFLYIMRADKSDLTVGVSANATVTVNAAVVMADKAKLASQVNTLTHGFGGAAAAAKADELASTLQGKVQNTIDNGIKDGAGLGFSADRQTARSMLYKYQISLDDAAINSTWNSLCNGHLESAAFAQGVRPLPGSGIENDLKSSFTLDLHLFNAFKAESVDSFFQNSSVVVTDTGALHYIYDVGKGNETQIGGALSKRRVHFVATADQTNPTTIVGAEVDLQFDFVAANSVGEAQRIAEAVAALAKTSPKALDALGYMRTGATAHNSTLTLTCILKPSAYGNISCSLYDRKPPADQSVDQNNWETFYASCQDLTPRPWIEGFSYKKWQDFNLLSRGLEAGTPDRRSLGGPNVVISTPSFWPHPDSGEIPLEESFLESTMAFMNLCDDLHGMAQALPSIDTPTAWKNLLSRLTTFTHDTHTDYSIPALAALLQLSKPAAIDFAPITNTNSFTCTLTIS